MDTYSSFVIRFEALKPDLKRLFQINDKVYLLVCKSFHSRIFLLGYYLLQVGALALDGNDYDALQEMIDFSSMYK